MKIKIPFKMFGKEEGEIIFEYPIEIGNIVSMSREESEAEATEDAEILGRYLGAFKDKFQKIILGYERVPGIESVYQTLIDCGKDDILRERLLELLRERREKAISSYDKEKKESN